MNPPTQPQEQLDPSIVNLAQAISKTETRGQSSPYTAKGGSGEYGAYQYTAPTWGTDSQKYLGQNIPLESATPAQQDEVAYKKIQDLGKQGYKPAQIASIWNSGKPDPTGNVGVNSSGVKYDTPSYVKSVEQAYNQLRGGQQVNVPATASTVGNTQIGTPDPTQPTDKSNILSKLLDFAFPIVSDVGNDVAGKSTKSPLQQLGDAGLSALWFVPGVGEAAEGAIDATRLGGLLGETGTKVAGQALGGAATGYGADVSSNLSQGKTGGAALTPGLGTVTGGALGGILGKLGSKYSESGVLDSLSEGNNSILGQTKRGANKLEDSFSQDKNPGSLLAEKKINLAAHINPDTVAYDVAEPAQKLRNDANTLTDALTQALQRVPGATTINDLQENLFANIDAKGLDKTTTREIKEGIQKELDTIRGDYGDELSAADMNEIKKRQWNLSHFDAATTNQQRLIHRTLGNSLKTSVEDLATKGGMPEVKAVNEYIGQHLDAADHLIGKNGHAGLNGTKAPGGRLGDLLKSHVGAELGGAAGFFGGGPVGALMGALVGHYGGKIAGRVIRKIQSSPIKTAILNKIVAEDPDFVQKMLAYAKQTPQGLEAIKEQLGQQGISIFDKLKGKENVSPILVPKNGSGKLTSGLLKSGVRLATPSSQ